VALGAVALRFCGLGLGLRRERRWGWWGIRMVGEWEEVAQSKPKRMQGGEERAESESRGADSGVEEYSLSWRVRYKGLC